MKTKLLVLLLAILTWSLSLQAQVHRTIHFVHGMNGDGNSMNRLNDYFVSRNYMFAPGVVIGGTFNYETNQGIQQSATELTTRLIAISPQRSINNPRDIVISHSMGGVNMRRVYLDAKQNSGSKAFGGLITMGTPHQGAKIANNILNGEVRKFYEDAVNKIKAGLVADPINRTLNEVFGSNTSALVQLALGPMSMINGFTRTLKTIFDLTIQKVAQFINIEQIIVDNIAGSRTVLSDLSVGSSALNQINKSLDIPVIAIYGDERSPSVLKLGSSITTTSELLKAGNKRLVENPDDTQLETLITKFKDVCRSMQQHQNNMLLQLPGYMFSSLFGPMGSYAKIQSMKYKAAQWKISGDFLEFGLDQGFMNLQGNYVNVYGTRQHCYYEYPDEWPIPRDPMLKSLARPLPGGTQEPVLVCRNISYVAYTETANDGLVSKATQTGVPGGTMEVKLVNINHEEFKIHAASGRALERILMGDIPNETTSNKSAFQVIPSRN